MDKLNPKALLKEEVEFKVKQRKEVVVDGLFRWLQ